VLVEQIRGSESVLHGGTAGVADEACYGRVRSYLRRTGAPEAAAASVEFLHGLAAWDFAAASRASDVLLKTAVRDSVYWLPATFVRNGTVVSRIKLGDYAGARAAFKAYVKFVDQDAFTARVLGAYLLEMERRTDKE
jgi:GH24 family phage-related lysozyme (muramidase)